MAISEAARADLYTGLAEVLGPERAETLMMQLPKYDPGSVVTVDNLSAFESRLNLRFDRLESRMDAFEGRMDAFEGRMDAFEGRMDAFEGRLDAFETRLDGFNNRLDRLFLALVAGLFVIVAAMAGVVFSTL